MLTNSKSYRIYRSTLFSVTLNDNNNNNNNPIYKAPKALASEALPALASGQLWVLLKSLMKEVRRKPRFKDRHNESALIIVSGSEFQTVGAEQRKLVSRSLSWSYCLSSIVGRQTSEVSVHWREPMQLITQWHALMARHVIALELGKRSWVHCFALAAPYSTELQ